MFSPLRGATHYHAASPAALSKLWSPRASRPKHGHLGHIRLYLATFQLPAAQGCVLLHRDDILLTVLPFTMEPQRPARAQQVRSRSPAASRNCSSPPSVASQTGRLSPRPEALVTHLSDRAKCGSAGQRPQSLAASPPCATVPLDGCPSPPHAFSSQAEGGLFRYSRLQTPTGLERSRQQNWVLTKPGT